MLITILATIGLFFLIVVSYKKGKRDGINQAIDYFVTEMNRKRIDIEVINDYDIIEKKQNWKYLKKFATYFGGRKMSKILRKKK